MTDSNISIMSHNDINASAIIKINILKSKFRTQIEVRGKNFKFMFSENED